MAQRQFTNTNELSLYLILVIVFFLIFNASSIEYDYIWQEIT